MEPKRKLLSEPEHANIYLQRTVRSSYLTVMPLSHPDSLTLVQYNDLIPFENCPNYPKNVI